MLRNESIGEKTGRGGCWEGEGVAVGKDGSWKLFDGAGGVVGEEDSGAGREGTKTDGDRLRGSGATPEGHDEAGAVSRVVVLISKATVVARQIAIARQGIVVVEIVVTDGAVGGKLMLQVTDVA